MKKQTVILSAVAAAMIGLSGCATQGLPTVDSSATQQVATYDVGTVQSIRYVAIKDNGAGTLVGAAIGAVLGHMVGHGHGKELATLGGGLAGAYVGNQAAAANAQELTVRLSNGKRVVVISKGVQFQVGQRVRIVRQGGHVVSVEPY
ncbi:glycine zipper 2TM domain-containing protein [Nitratifractor sp.]|uniref:glycine zipper 2TM domain-containing protein n=1 Tax=Nitratifractor sp. TaxID=2268144 RepID=UPI0025E912E3|nr:glycine zipper 2TM domain-containing protein [Nitratifractor sp.]